MQVINSSNQIQKEISDQKAKGNKVAFVATMGALHEGHLEMIRDAKSKYSIVVCSIFVNPLQFNRKEDFDTYPDRTIEDKLLLEKNNCDILFLPKYDQVFPIKPAQDYDLNKLGNSLEAKYRPGHFEGVVSVVKRLFDIIMPNAAYFGEKDYQQVAVVKWLISKFNYKVNLIVFPTVRNKNGLALSSRNYNLNEPAKIKASSIYKSMLYCLKNKGEYPPKKLLENAINKLGDAFEIDYFEIVDENTFLPVLDWEQTESPRVFIAAYLDNVRLIDNLSLN